MSMNPLVHDEGEMEAAENVLRHQGRGSRSSLRFRKRFVSSAHGKYIEGLLTGPALRARARKNPEASWGARNANDVSAAVLPKKGMPSRFGTVEGIVDGAARSQRTFLVPSKAV
jgi:hypothetical protein